MPDIELPDHDQIADTAAITNLHRRLSGSLRAASNQPGTYALSCRPST